MFDIVHENKKWVQIILAVIILPFAFWGVDSYRKSGGGEALATVNGEKISQQEFDKAMQQQQGRMQQMLGNKFDPAILEKPEVKRSVLEDLASQRLLVLQAKAAGLTISDEQLGQVIGGIDAFQNEGKFDNPRYVAVLRAQGMSPLMFESKVKDELTGRQLTDAYVNNGYASASVADKLIHLNEEQRVVSMSEITVDSFINQIAVNDAQVKAYYEKNAAEFQTTEQARVEYVTLSAEALMPQMVVTDAEVKKYYEEHQPEFGSPEQRQAAHILIAVAAQASEADKKAAKAKAESVLQQVNQAPAKFAELAKQFSQDPGSAANGGDLGMFGRGMMVKPFDDAAFNLKPGEISGLVQSDFGFHIIKLLAIKPGKLQEMAEAKAAIAQRLKLQKAGDKFTELAEKFSNVVYEQSDTLKPAAELAKSPVSQSGWLSKTEAGNPLWTEKTLHAVFSKEVMKDKRNSTAIEIAPNVMLALRMLEHKPASTRTLAEVGETIKLKLIHQQALELAVKQGKETLEKLKHGEKLSLVWKAGQSMTRAQLSVQAGELVSQVFQVSAAKLPAYVGVEDTKGGYRLMRVDEIKDVGVVDEAKKARYVQEISKITGEELIRAYLAEAKKHADIKIKPFAVDEK